MRHYQLTEETIERIYAGWLGKVIGIRLGAPVESWTAEKIAEVYGETWNYPVDYGTFAADDDSNGPVFFVRALKDSGRGAELSAQDVAEALLNYAPYEHGFFWWGGYGVSTEHTAYLNLRNGIPAPESGSIKKNGSTIAEQIGGQIFIDPWGLVAPGNPALAARLAEKAASVTHDGNGIYGGIFIACCISLAFTGCPVREMIDGALAFIPEESEYARVVRAVERFYDSRTAGTAASAAEKCDWRAAFQYVKENFGYDRYPGWCHIIPNAAVIVLALLYGDDDFTKTLCIANMCGWDTDCNVGNLGAIMGVRCGLSGIEYDRWRKPVNDLLLCSGVMGSLNIMDIPYGAQYMAECAFALAGQELPGIWRGILTDEAERCHFEFPGSTHAMRVRCEANPDTPTLEAHIRNTDETAASGKRSLRMHAFPLKCGQNVYLYQKTWYEHSELHDDRYEPAFSPKIYPGQRVSAWVRIPEDRTAATACLYVTDVNGGTCWGGSAADACAVNARGDSAAGACAAEIRGNAAAGAREIAGEKVRLAPGVWTELTFQIPRMEGALLGEVGVKFTVPGDSQEQQDFVAFLDDLVYGGDPDYTVDFARERELELPMSHYEITQFTKLKGWTFLEDGAYHLTSENYGETYTGSHLFRDYAVTAAVEPVCGGGHFVNVRVQGGQRSYAAGFDGEGRLVILKNEGCSAANDRAEHLDAAERKRCGGYRVLAETAFAWEYGRTYELTVRVKGAEIAVLDADGGELLAVVDTDRPYLQGAVGFSVQGGGHIAVHGMEVRAV